jgi:hypothetical protein
MTQNRKLLDWAEREVQRNIDHLILDNDDGSILAFGIYSILPTQDGAQVWRGQVLEGRFSNRSIALGWCVAQRLGRVTLSISIRELDSRKQQLAQDLGFSQQLLAVSKKPEFRSMLTDKLQRKQINLAQIKRELEKCVNLTKYLQLRGFTNETARTRHS